MDSGDKSGSDREHDDNQEIKNALASESSEMHQNSPDSVTSAEHLSPLALGEDHLPRATDLLISVSVRAEENKQKIANLVFSATQELAQLVIHQEALWQLDIDSGTYFLNDVEYKRRFSPLDPSLEKIVQIIKTEGPMQVPDLNENAEILPVERGQMTLDRECTLDTGLVRMSPVNLVEIFMDVDKWSMLLSSIVSKAKLLEVISVGKQGSLDGALQVMTAEFHVSSPLVKTRECYFARCCRQITADTWVIVDVSLESIFPNPATRFIRRPSGCYFQSVGNGHSKVTWIEHSEVDNTLVHNLYKPLVTSGFAFGAKRWVETLARQCERAFTARDDRVAVMLGGRRSLLRLADRMMRGYYSGVSASAEKVWQPIPVAGAEDILVTTSYNEDDPQTPLGVSITVTTTIWLPANPKSVFEFLRNGDNRNQWDLLSLNSQTREIARVTTGLDQANYVSLVSIDTSPLIYYMHESHATSTGSYVVYAPIDIFAVNSVLAGNNPDNVQILASGFAVLPDHKPRSRGEDDGGTLLTIAFHIVDEYASTPEYLPPISVMVAYTIITQTAALIRAAVTK